jgi:hypothetical protein
MISEILDRMHSNLWLTDAQIEYIKTTDKVLGQEVVDLAKKLNNALK